jgi:hypothetical protein
VNGFLYFRGQKKNNQKTKMNNLFRKKNFCSKIFWINWGSGKHEEKFLEVERRSESSKNLEKKVNSLTGTEMVVLLVVVVLVFF